MCACSEDAQTDNADRSSNALAQMQPTDPEDAPTRGQIGQVQYGFDPRHLTRAEVQLPIPLDFKDTVWATKLIPRERADALGGKTCHYGTSAPFDVCTAESEDGLTMALLERPIGDYRRALLDRDVSPDELVPDRIADTDGFSFSTQFDHQNMRYRYFPIGDRTLLLATRADQPQATRDPAIAQVLANLVLPSAS